MRLECQSCGSRFKIADDRVRGRILHVRCRSCGTVLEASLPRQTADPQQPAEQLAAATEAERREVSRREPPPLPEREWFAALGDRQVGPLSTEEMCLRLRRGELGAEDLVWRRGLGLWQPVVAVEELRGALNEPRLPAEMGPPPLPPRQDSRLLRLVPGGRAGGPALAVAEPYLEAAPVAVPQPLPLVSPAPVQPARWPLWVALLGGLMMVSSSAVLLIHRRSGHSAVEAAVEVSRRAEGASPVSSLRIEPEVQRPAAGAQPGQPSLFPGIELRRPRKQAAVTAPADELPPDRSPEVPERWAEEPGLADELGARRDDVKTALALRIYRRNRSTLEACDRLAERRGETLRAGSRAEFQVRLLEGKSSIEVRGKGVSEALVSCYRAVTSRWELPKNASDYATSFEHVH